MFSDAEVALMANQQDLKRALSQWMAHAKALESELAKKDADIAGLLAQVDALKAEHPKSALLTPSNEFWKSGKFAGKPKTKLRKVYEAAFDAEARKKGFATPDAIRTN